VKVGFTGTQFGMTGDQANRVFGFLTGVGLQAGSPLEFHHGGCVGSDVQAAELARQLGYRTIRHPGDNDAKQDTSFVDDEILEVLGNLIRNRIIVEEVDVMVAAPKEQDEVVRSGTWAAIRYARTLGRDLYLVLPDGTASLTRKEKR